jgi:hypothetical protein
MAIGESNASEVNRCSVIDAAARGQATHVVFDVRASKPLGEGVVGGFAGGVVGEPVRPLPPPPQPCSQTHTSAAALMRKHRLPICRLMLLHSASVSTWTFHPYENFAGLVRKSSERRALATSRASKQRAYTAIGSIGAFLRNA